MHKTLEALPPPALADAEIYLEAANRLLHCAHVLQAGMREVQKLGLGEEPLRNDLFHAIDQAVTMLYMLHGEAMNRLGLVEDEGEAPF